MEGKNASEVSFTRFMASLVVAYAVDFQSDLLTDTTFGSAASSEGIERLFWSFPRADRVWLGTVLGSASDEKMRSDSPPGTRNKIVCIPFGSWSRGIKGLGASKVEVPIRRSGTDSAGCGTT